MLMGYSVADTAPRIPPIARHRQSMSLGYGKDVRISVGAWWDGHSESAGASGLTRVVRLGGSEATTAARQASVGRGCTSACSSDIQR